MGKYSGLATATGLATGLAIVLCGVSAVPSMAQSSNSANAPGPSIWDAAPINLDRGKKYMSPSGRHYLIHQHDGNLAVFTADNRYVWGVDRSTNRFSESNFVEVGQGNIVLVGPGPRGAVWSAFPRHADGQDFSAKMSLAPDGVLRLRSSSRGNPIIWASDGRIDRVTQQSSAPIASTSAAPSASVVATGAVPQSSPAAATARNLPAGMTQASHQAAIKPSMDTATAFPIRPGQTIDPGKKYVSPDGTHYLIQGSDGNLMLKTVVGDRYIWGLDRQGVALNRIKLIRMAPDGKLIAIDAEGNVLWSPVGPDAKAGSYLTISNGNLNVVSPAPAITWSSTEPKAAVPAGQKVELPPLPSRCVPKAGFAKCRMIASPRIMIHGTARTSDSAMDFVKTIYTDMASKLKPAFPKSKLNFVEVLITNDETAAELSKLPGIGDNGRPASGGDNSNAWLLGGGGPNTTWVTEQMMCKTGVKTRGARDKESRTYDQVVHEFAHTMSFRFNYLPTVNRVFVGSPVPAEEAFPYAVQAWFDPSPKYSAFRTPAFDAELAKMFTAKGSYSCTNYKG